MPAPIGAELDDLAPAARTALRSAAPVLAELAGRLVDALRRAGILGAGQRLGRLDDVAAAEAAFAAGQDVALLPDSGIRGRCDPGWRGVRDRRGMEVLAWEPAREGHPAPTADPAGFVVAIVRDWTSDRSRTRAP